MQPSSPLLPPRAFFQSIRRKRLFFPFGKKNTRRVLDKENLWNICRFVLRMWRCRVNGRNTPICIKSSGMQSNIASGRRRVGYSRMFRSCGIFKRISLACQAVIQTESAFRSGCIIWCLIYASANGSSGRVETSEAVRIKKIANSHDTISQYYANAAPFALLLCHKPFPSNFPPANAFFSSPPLFLCSLLMRNDARLEGVI